MTIAQPVPYLTDPTGREHRLTSDTITIGRAVECEIVITSKRVSRRHSSIRREEWQVVLQDLDSTNGTFLNDERVMTPQPLHDGDHITIGDVTFVFHDPDVTYADTAFPELEVDAAAGVVRVNRRAIGLSPKEFELVTFLYERRGQVCSKDDIGHAVWPEYQEDVYDYQIENLMRRLRAKIEPDPAHPQLLLTLRGLGYKLVARE